MKNYKIAVIKGDGIGPEIINEAVKVLKVVGEKFSFRLDFEDYLMGGIAYDLTGNPLPNETIEGCLKAEAIPLGAIRGENWQYIPSYLRLKRGISSTNKFLDVFDNLDPDKVYA